jgi:hypothetical protein
VPPPLPAAPPQPPLPPAPLLPAPLPPVAAAPIAPLASPPASHEGLSGRTADVDEGVIRTLREQFGKGVFRELKPTERAATRRPDVPPAASSPPVTSSTGQSIVLSPEDAAALRASVATPFEARRKAPVEVFSDAWGPAFLMALDQLRGSAAA